MHNLSKSLLKAARRGKLCSILEEAMAATVVNNLVLSPAMDPEDDDRGGWIPGFASISGHEETVWEFCSARDSGLSVEELRALLVEDAQTDADASAADRFVELEEDVKALPFYAPAKDCAFEVDSGLVVGEHLAHYDTVILDQDENVAGRLSFAILLLPNERDLQAEDPVDEAARFELKVLLSELRVLNAYRGQGASYAAMEFVSYAVYEQLQTLASQLRKPAKSLHLQFAAHVAVHSSNCSQMAIVVRKKLREHLAGHLDLMIETEDEFDATADEGDTPVSSAIDVVEVYESGLNVKSAPTADASCVQE